MSNKYYNKNKERPLEVLFVCHQCNCKFERIIA
jgi:hypothetical protein